MLKATRGAKGDEAQIVLNLLTLIEGDSAQSQRRLAKELGIALGLVNVYVRRCVAKGLMKVRSAPARRYAYYLTPKGLAEKSRLTVEYFTSSLNLFRQAKADCCRLFEVALGAGLTRVALVGCSDLAEIAVICAKECEIEIVVIIDPTSKQSNFAGMPVINSFEAISVSFDAVVITDLEDAAGSATRAAARLGSDRVFIPHLLGVVLPKKGKIA